LFFSLTGEALSVVSAASNRLPPRDGKTLRASPYVDVKETHWHSLFRQYKDTVLIQYKNNTTVKIFFYRGESIRENGDREDYPKDIKAAIAAYI